MLQMTHIFGCVAAILNTVKDGCKCLIVSGIAITPPPKNYNERR